MKKILILYAKYGGGHLAAANSISKYIEIIMKMLKSEL